MEYTNRKRQNDRSVEEVNANVSSLGSNVSSLESPTGAPGGGEEEEESDHDEFSKIAASGKL